MLGGWGYLATILFGLLGSFIKPLAILSMAGAILVLIAFFRAAREYNRPQIRNGVIFSIIMGVTSICVFAVLVSGTLAIAMNQPNLHPGHLLSGALIGGLIASWLLGIAASWFWYRASNELAKASNQPLFKSGGLLILIGTLTLVVFGLGAIVSLVGEILQTVAFFSSGETPQ